MCSGSGSRRMPISLRSGPNTPISSARAGFITEHGGVAYLAHPYWTGATPGTLELPENVAGIEVWNAGCELEVGRGLSSVHWDELLETGRRCFGLATDDSHHPGFDSGHGWTVARAASEAPRRCSPRSRQAPSTAARGQCCTTVCGRRERSRGALQPAPLGDSRLRSHQRRCRERRASRLPLRGRGALPTTTAGSRTRRLRRPFGAAYARIEVTGREGQSRVDESVARDLSQLAERRFDLLGDRRRHRRRRDRERGGAGGSCGRARRSRRLRRRRPRARPRS